MTTKQLTILLYVIGTHQIFIGGLGLHSPYTQVQVLESEGIKIQTFPCVCVCEHTTWHAHHNLAKNKPCIH